MKRSPLVLILYFMFFFRPIVLLKPVLNLVKFRLLDIYSIIVTYGLLLATLVDIQNLRWRTVSSLIIAFCLYCGLSLLWGSNLREIARVVFPFVVFFAIEALVTNRNQAEMLIKIFIIGLSLTILINFFEIAILGKSGEIFRGYGQSVIRYGGLTGGEHTLAHMMSVFWFTFFLCSIFNFDMIKKRKICWYVLLIMSLYCIYKSYTRTVFLGLVIFILVYSYGLGKKKFITCLLIIISVVLIFKGILFVAFGDVKEALKYKEYYKAGSGRIKIWTTELNKFEKFSFDRKILGIGLGYEKFYTRFKKERYFIARSHNDFLGLLMTLGIIGFLLYIAILALCLRDVINSSLETRGKFFFFGFLISIIFMNFISNSYLSRVQLSQVFWMFMGLFYIRDRILT